MDFEKKMADITSSLFTEGWVEQQVTEAVKTAIQRAINDQFSYGGIGYKKIKQVVEESVEKTVANIAPEYIPKLEIVLAEIMSQTVVAEKKRILENFRVFMTDTDIPDREKNTGTRRIELSEIFKVYRKYVSAHFDTEDRNIDYDDEPTYYPVECKAWIEEEDKNRGYFRSMYRHASLYLVTEDGQDEHGKSCNFKVPLIMWNAKEGWSISKLDEEIDFGNILRADPMLCYIYKLKSNFVHIEDTGEELDDYVDLDEKPECDWS